MRFPAQRHVVYYLRFALSASFLSAVADRFGLWGQPGQSGVAWGTFDNFVAYTTSLNPFVPTSLIPALAWIATVLEIIFGVSLLIGFKLKPIAFLSGGLLALFAVSMTYAHGPKGPLDFSVFSASAAGFSLFILLKDETA